MLGFCDFYSICLVSGHHYDGIITDIQRSCSYSQSISEYALNCDVIVGVITRVISVIADATVLGVTFWNTFHVVNANKEARATSKLTTTLTLNGRISSVFL